jgi:hypothetical protein
MGTRGSLGFRIDGQDKLTYCQFDSYPEGVGAEMLEELCGKWDWEQVKTNVRRLAHVREVPPTEQQIEENKQWSDLSVSEGTYSDWYCLLRQMQGRIGPYMSGECTAMYKANNFVLESVFCEYAYIVNLDDMTLEFYRGFNSSPMSNAGRYAGTQTPAVTRSDGSTYQSDSYGVVLVDTVPLTDLPKTKRCKTFVNKTVSRWSRKAHESKDEARHKT